MKTYRHDFLVYSLFPITYFLVAYWGYEATQSAIQPGKELGRYLFLSFIFGWCIVSGYLFVRYALVQYYLQEEGLKIQKFGSTRVHAWSDLMKLDINHTFKYFVVRNTKNKVVVGGVR